MQTVAPQIARPQQRVLHLQVGQMRPGELFRLPHDQQRVLALLTHSQIDVRDAAQIWTVVVAASPHSASHAGMLLPLACDTPVEVLRVEQPMQLAAVA